MVIPIADRVKDIPEYAFAKTEKKISQMVSSGKDVIKLHIGSPDLSAPPLVIESLYASALEPTHHGYGGFSGTPTLRKAFADYYSRRFGVHLDSQSQILPLIGSKEGLFNLSLAFLNPGDIILAPDPGYPTYEIGARIAGAEIYPLPLTPENHYLPDLEGIPDAIVERAKLLWICYPNNPTGAVVELEDLLPIVKFCKEHHILLCSDNPYCDVTFGDYLAPSVLQIDGAIDVTVEFNSLSKTYNMAGWRVGVCVGNSEVISALGSLKSNIDSGIFRAIQDAAVTALTDVSDEWIRERNRVYERRRDIIINALDDIGLQADPPKGGLYVWAKAKSGDEQAYVARALDEGLVSIAPGSLYGLGGKGFVRFSLVQEESRILEAMQRLARIMKTCDPV